MNNNNNYDMTEIILQIFSLILIFCLIFFHFFFHLPPLPPLPPAIVWMWQRGTEAIFSG